MPDAPAPEPTIARMTDEELGGRGSVLVLQRRDHARLDVLLDRVEATTGDEQDEVLEQICRLAFPHAFAEEAILWPALRKALPDAEELTLEVEQEHQEINEILAAVDRSRQGDPDRQALIDRAVELLRQDVRDEEDELFPRMRAAMSTRDLRRLGATWALVRRTAPTRAHPVVARRPPGNVLSALPLSALDRSRDVLDRHARSASGRTAALATTASRGLAAVAGRVEQLPPMRRGEDPSTHSGRTRLED